MSTYKSRIGFEFHFDAEDANGAVAKISEIEKAIVIACSAIGVGVPDRITEIFLSPPSPLELEQSKAEAAS